MKLSPDFFAREARPEDIPALVAICQAVYPSSPPWTEAQLKSHQRIFPEGQFVAESRSTGRVVGLASSLIVFWDDYPVSAPWRDFTDKGMFTNHDPAKGRTLYGAEIMVHPEVQGKGAGHTLYHAREDLVRRRKLLRIRAGARLRGYHSHAAQMSAEEYVLRVVRGELRDPTLSFQLRHGFQVLWLVENYLAHDPESLGFAAVIEWINPEVAVPSDLDAARRSKFYRSLREGR